MKRQSITAVLLAAMALLVLLLVNACGARHRAAPLAEPATTPEGAPPAQTPDSQMWLSALKDAAGAPMGVRVSWDRSAETSVQGYYIYRDTQPLSTRDPQKRINNGNLIPQGPPETPLMSFDDLFTPVVDATYYYRITAVDYEGDESPFSAQRSITIGRFDMSGFTPHAGPVGCEVRIDGSHFGTYNPLTDHIYFSGVVDDKAPSTLQPGKVEATIDPADWTDRRILVKVPRGTTFGPITLVVGGSSVDTADDFNCTSPYITSVTPDPVTSGESLSIDGSNLGSHQIENRLLLNGVPYATITDWSSTHVSATVPTGIEPGLYEVQLRVKLLTRMEDTNSAWIDIIGLPPQPQIDKVSPLYGEPGATEIAVTGHNFGQDPSIAELHFNGVTLTANDFTSYSDDEIQLVLPGAVTRTGEVQLILHAAQDVPSNKYRYTANIPGPTVPPNGVAAGFDLGRYSAVAYDSTGKLHVLFTDNTANSERCSLFMAHQESGNNFSYEAIESQYGAKYSYVAMAIDSSDNIHIAYQRQPSQFSEDKEVRYGYFDGSSWSLQTVYSASGESPGDYVDIALSEDPDTRTEIYIAWRNATTGNVQLGYWLPGATTWAVVTAFTGDLGYHLAIDTLSYPAGTFAPPKTPSAVGGGMIGFSFASYESQGDSYYVVFGYSVDLESFSSDLVDDRPFSEVKETDIEFEDVGSFPIVMWVTSNAVYCAANMEGWSVETVLSDTSSIGAGSRLKMNAGFLPRIFGHRSGSNFYYAYRDMQGWHVSNLPAGNSHVLDASGRWDMAYNTKTDDYALSFYDGTYRDAHVFIHVEGGSNSNVGLGDNFAEPGYDLTNRSVVVGSDGRPRVIFTDRDTTTGTKVLYFGKFVGGETPPPGPPFNQVNQWDFISIDSTDQDILGRATMALDGQDRFNACYLRYYQWSDMMGSHEDRCLFFSRGDINGFSTPIIVAYVGLTNTYTPRIAIGSSDEVAYIVHFSTADNELVLFRSDNGYQSSDAWAVTREAPVSEYDVAAHHNSDSAVVAYYSVESNGIVLKDYADDSTTLLPGTAGLDTGLSLMLDEDEHASIICADVSGTGALKWIHWDTGAGSYVVEDIAADASASLTTSQAGTEWGPAATYYNTSTGNHTLLLSFLNSVGDWNDLQVASTFGSSQPIRHSVDAYGISWFVTALNGGNDFAKDLVVLDVQTLD